MATLMGPLRGTCAVQMVSVVAQPHSARVAWHGAGTHTMLRVCKRQVTDVAKVRGCGHGLIGLQRCTVAADRPDSICELGIPHLSWRRPPVAWRHHCSAWPAHDEHFERCNVSPCVTRLLSGSVTGDQAVDCSAVRCISPCWRREGTCAAEPRWQLARSRRLDSEPQSVVFGRMCPSPRRQALSLWVSKASTVSGTTYLRPDRPKRRDCGVCGC